MEEKRDVMKELGMDPELRDLHWEEGEKNAPKALGLEPKDEINNHHLKGSPIGDKCPFG